MVSMPNHLLLLQAVFDNFTLRKRCNMTTGRALLYSLAITVISAILLTITRGMPTAEQAATSGGEMFLVAFVVLRFFYRPTQTKGSGE
jgi:hypothetical protein